MFSLGRRGRRSEARTHARAGIRGQGELAAQLLAAVVIGKLLVHLAGVDREEPVAEQALGHALVLGLAITRLHGHQDQ